MKEGYSLKARMKNQYFDIPGFILAILQIALIQKYESKHLDLQNIWICLLKIGKIF